MEALVYQRDEEQARTNEALAYLLVDDVSTCHEKASLLRLQYPANARVAGLWVSSAPREKPLYELEASVNAVLRADGEVAAALSRRAIVEHDYDKAIQYSNAAIAASPRWAQPHLAVVEVNVARALRLDLGFQPINENQSALLKEAEEKCSLAIEISRADKDRNSEVAALVRRVDVRLLLKEREAASCDADEAYRLEPGDPTVLAARARVYLTAGKSDEGIALLKRSYDLDARPDVALNYGKALFERGYDGDLEDAGAVLRKLCLKDFRPEFRPVVVTLLMQCLSKRRAWAEAAGYLAEVSLLLDSAVVEAIEGYLAFYQERREEADRHASEALKLTGAGASTDTKQFLARLLMLLGRRSEALPFGRNYLALDLPGFDPGNLLDCAARLKGRRHIGSLRPPSCEGAMTGG